MFEEAAEFHAVVRSTTGPREGAGVALCAALSQLLRRRLPYDGDALRPPFDASLALGSTTYPRARQRVTAEVGSTPDTVERVSDPTTGVQTCYRHDDRRAGVRCQRCGRAICPDCMNQASVGFHCPECVRAGAQRVVTARTLAAGSTPYVTTTLIALNIAVYVMSTVAGGGSAGGSPSFRFQLDWALIGSGRMSGGPLGVPIGVAEGEWYRLVTSGFLHGGLLHLGFNMFALWILGRQLEPALGRVNFAAIYFSSLLAGSLGVMVLDPGQLTLGASGAVFGLFGYALVGQWARGINPMDTGLGGIIVINLIFTFAVPGISIGGHLGGLLGGAAAGALVDVVRPRIGAPAWVGTMFVAVLGAGCAVMSVAIGNGL